MKSFGNRGGGPEKQPGRPMGRPQPGQRPPANRGYGNENYQQDESQYSGQFPNQQGMPNQGQGQWQGQQGQGQQWQGQQQGQWQGQQQNQWQGQGQGQYQDQGEPESGSAVRIEPGKRAGALLIDFVCAYFIGVILSVPMTFIPFINQFFNTSFAMPLVLLFRDCLFSGRGFGKNLMGLQVVDARTGRPCTLVQSFKRNIILCAPYVVLLIVKVVLDLLQLANLPLPWWQTAHKMVHDSITGLIQIVGMIYVAVVLPMECYRAWKRPDSLRKGDEFAGTMVVEAGMDFSNPLPR